jgi:aminoglycoside 3-N-acetyltransferase
MSEEKVISKTKEPITIDNMSRDLIKLGIQRGDILIVHSSLSNIGWVCGGAQSVILALMNVLGDDGTLVMPAQSGDWSDPAEWENPPIPKEWLPIIYENMPAFDPDITPTRGMGRIAELFRTFPGTMRSTHPQVSFCANGKFAKEILEQHDLTPQFGMNSPLGKLYELGAKVLLLGVGYENCTSFHLAEAMIDKMPKKRMGTALMENGQRVWKWFEDYIYDPDDFDKIGQSFEENYMIHQGIVGSANCKLFRVKDCVDFAKSWLKENRFA